VEANEVGGREMGREAEERQDITAVATVLDYRIRLPCTAHDCKCFSKYNFNILGKCTCIATEEKNIQMEENEVTSIKFAPFSFLFLNFPTKPPL
jgi:hypothetical protein